MKNYDEGLNNDRAVTAEPKPNPLPKLSVAESPSGGSLPPTVRNIHLALTPDDRLVFLAVQTSALGITPGMLSRTTGLEWDEVQSRVAALQSHGLITKIGETGPYYSAIPSLSTEPLHPHWEDLLEKFWELFPPSIEGDTMGTTYGSCGAVLLTAMISGSDEHRIAQATTFPLKFVRLVLEMAEGANVWMRESFHELRRTVQVQPVNLSDLDVSIQNATEDFWELAWTPELHHSLQKSRAARQVGGMVDIWVDEEGGCSF